MLSIDETKLERRSLARNELLFRQGDKVEAIYFIEEGRLRLDRRIASYFSGQERTSAVAIL
jgi:CRP-like cAMP-binding protein